MWNAIKPGKLLSEKGVDKVPAKMDDEKRAHALHNLHVHGITRITSTDPGISVPAP
jgi:hypothetical protein